MPTLPQVTIITILAIAVGTPLTVIVKSILDFWRASGSKGYIVLKAVGALAVWILVSWGMMFMFFVTVFGAAHTEYRMSHGGAPDPSGNDDPTRGIIMMGVIYGLAGTGLIYWMLRRARA